jgi:hypothetical protein
MKSRSPNSGDVNNLFPSDGLMSMMYGIAGDLERPIELEKPTPLDRCEKKVDGDGRTVSLSIRDLMKSRRRS